MSLVNLSHVCSHLQNASLARLGLTSIPYTKLHLSLSLLLHKQGFLSQLKLAGPSPPASCFPPSLPDNHHVTAAPHRHRDARSGEAALHDMVHYSKSEQQLRLEGFGEEALEFAREHREMTKEQLEKEGWDGKAIDFIIEHGPKSQHEVPTEGHFDAQALRILAHYNDALFEVQDDLARQGIPQYQLTRNQLESRIRQHLRRQGFDRETLAYFAGPARFRTPRHLAQDGITISAMGIEIPNQPLTTLPPQYRDPDDLETEGVVTQANRASRRLWLGLKYWDGLPVLRKARMISKPTKRIWLDAQELGKVVRGSRSGEVRGMTTVGEVMAVSTDRGIMEARECVERRTGGLVLCRIW